MIVRCNMYVKCSLILCALYKIVKMEEETLLEHLTRSELIEKFSNAANYTVLFCESRNFPEIHIFLEFTFFNVQCYLVCLG